ncbi:MAG: GNAT family N-acetyltransferase [Planctomycetes bacterium]|nr:GNAT family N-acetyltransferase [Planctomycetota bacterium]MBI3843146.1 GNAT family N-acetyltransferase [Planctomycetota bacterium]
MACNVRSIAAADAEACGRIAFEAHRAVAAKHDHPPELPSLEFATGLVRAKIQDANARGWVAEVDGRIAGSLFLNAFPALRVAAIGPMTVDPTREGGVGRALMDAAMEDAIHRQQDGVRLVQSPSHLRSLALYTKVGFDVREPLLFMQGKPLAGEFPGVVVRPATDADVGACNALCSRVHGLEREFELRGAIAQRTATVTLRGDDITGYATGIGFRGHAVARQTEDVMALICAARSFIGPGFFLPTRNGDLHRYLLGAGFRAVWQATLMTMGRYQEPAGAFLPSIAF